MENIYMNMKRCLCHWSGISGSLIVIHSMNCCLLETILFSKRTGRSYWRKMRIWLYYPVQRHVMSVVSLREDCICLWSLSKMIGITSNLM